LALAAEECQQPLIVDIEAESLGGGVEISAVDKERDALGWIEMHLRIPSS
jgi:hypothetical protein